MFSQTQEYALRAIVWLAAHTDVGPVGNQRIAKETGVPASYLSKIMQELVRVGLLESRRGAGGGFWLRRKPEELPVLEVINAVDPLRRIKTCPLGLESHGSTLCPLHRRMDEALAMVEKALGESTIAEVLAEPGQPLPLVDRIAALEISDEKI